MTSVSWIGQTLNNRYRIEQLLGQGGMSSVYKANDPNLRRTVAVKMIHPHLSGNPDFLRRFEEEAAAVAQLRHENIIQVFDFNHEGDAYYMVMEFIPGETLESRLKRLNEKSQRMEMTDATQFLTGVCEAASYAHSKGVIHRDIKSANIMLDVHGKAILMDFGIARIVGGQMHTAAGAVIGTALYMAPEQIKGERVDERADIYSLGVTLFEAVSGKPPFEADSAMTLMMMHLNDPVPDIRQLRPRVPESLVQVIAKALEKRREDRYQSAGEMAAALRVVYTELTSPAARQTGAARKDIEQTQVELEVERTVLDIRPEKKTDPPSKRQETPDLEPTVSARHDPKPAQAQSFDQTSPPPTGDAGAARQYTVAQADNKPFQGDPVQSSLQDAQPGQAASTSRKGGSRTILYVLGGLVLLAILCIAGTGVAANFFINRAKSNLPGVISGLVPTQAQAIVTNPAGAGSTIEAVATQFSTLVATDIIDQAQSTLLAAGSPATTGEPVSPTDAATPIGPAVRIKAIAIQNGRYVVDYQTFGYTEKLDSLHMHFFFNTVPPDQAGMPGKGPWILYGGPRPFRGYLVANRPANATQMCVLVANPDHSVQANSGNCVDLPYP